jgi:hypothetical protein
MVPTWAAALPSSPNAFDRSSHSRPSCLCSIDYKLLSFVSQAGGRFAGGIFSSVWMVICL